VGPQRQQRSRSNGRLSRAHRLPLSARFDTIAALDPDLVLAFSDLQADLGAELVRRGIAVVTFNQRSVAEILQMIRMLGGLVGCQADGERLAARLEGDLEHIRRSAARFPARLTTFFEEWDDPLISGIRWVEELVELAGGAPIFPELANARLARDRIVDPFEVARRDPEQVFASSDILQPGPACLTDGVRQLHAVLARAHGLALDASLTPRTPA